MKFGVKSWWRREAENCPLGVAKCAECRHLFARALWRRAWEQRQAGKGERCR